MRRALIASALITGAVAAVATPTATATPTAVQTSASVAPSGRGAATAATTTERSVAFRAVTSPQPLRTAAGVSGHVTLAAQAQVLDTGAVAVPSDLAVIGATWAEGTGSGLHLSYRAERDGRWEPWQEVDIEDCDECAAPGASTRAGSEPIAVTGATRIQARLVAQGSPVRDPRLAVIDPSASAASEAADAAVVAGTPVGAASIAAGDVAVNPVLGMAPGSIGVRRAPTGLAAAPSRLPAKRSAWRALETPTMRDLPEVAPRGIVIHHTAGSNTYSANQVPGILRGIQRFHVKDRGWSDIGYNVLVDHYGRVWQGRPGGITAPHKGAHARGVNETYLGISYIGDTTARKATAAGVKSIVDLVGWSSARYGFDPLGTLRVNGRTKPVVAGHYQVGSTDCPGVDLTRRLQEIRERSARRANEYRAAAGR